VHVVLALKPETISPCWTEKMGLAATVIEPEHGPAVKPPGNVMVNEPVYTFGDRLLKGPVVTVPEREPAGIMPFRVCVSGKMPPMVAVIVKGVPPGGALPVAFVFILMVKDWVGSTLPGLEVRLPQTGCIGHVMVVGVPFTLTLPPSSKPAELIPYIHMSTVCGRPSQYLLLPLRSML
jgi:hypothetical protein